MRNTWLILFFAILSSLPLAGQKEFNNWYFGNYAGITFNTSDSSPVALTDGVMFQQEGCATISDKDGRLLFYTDGDTVFDRTHAIMSNGTGLYGNETSSQSALVFPAPGSKTLYYIFTADQGGYYGSDPKGINYSVVDMSKNNGLGDVVSKNMPLFRPATEKLAVALHRNKKYVWVITHEWQSNTFRSYLVTNRGVQQEAVKSSAGTSHNGSLSNTIGTMKADRKGSKLALAVKESRIVEVFDFDNATGVVSNARKVSIPSQSDAYGMEFSADGSKLYLTTYTIPHGEVYQIDLNKDISNTTESVTKIDNYDNAQSLARGPDGKIYVAVYLSLYLSCINNPDSPGSDCQYTSNAVYLKGRHSLVGLPNTVVIPAAYIDVRISSDSYYCQGDTIRLGAKTDVESAKGFSYYWSGPNGYTSREKEAVIYNAAPSMTGWYRLEISSDDLGGEDSVYIRVLPKPDITIELPKRMDGCLGVEKRFTVRIRNNNSEASHIKEVKFADGSYFSTDNYTGVINPQEEKDLTVKFFAGTLGYYEDTLVVVIDGPCPGRITAFLRAEAADREKFSLPDTTVNVGDEIEIPLTMQFRCNKQFDDKEITFEAQVRYDASAFYPSQEQNSGISDQGIFNGDRIINISGVVPTVEMPPSVKYIKGQVLLALKDVAPLYIENVRLSDPRVLYETRDGALRITGICQKNLSRVMPTTGLTMNIAPTPASGTATVVLEGESEGEAILTISDIRGETVWKGRADKPKGRMEMSLDVSTLAQGIYRITVQLKGETGTKALVVVR